MTNYFRILFIWLVLFGAVGAYADQADDTDNPESCCGDPDSDDVRKACLPPNNLIHGKCCPESLKYVVGGNCSFCPTGKHKVGTQCCDLADNNIVNGQCSFCPAGKQKVGNQCCNLTEDFIVAGRCSVCSADQKLIGNKCCAKTDNFVVGGQCSVCSADQKLIGGKCCAKTDNFVVGGQCSFCEAGKHKVGTQCCDLADNNIVNGQCSFCPAGKQKVGNQCCNLTEDFIVAGRCSVCSADQKLIGNKCCAKTDNFVVGGQCSVCSADQKLIGGKCCAKTDNFVVGGQCSFCEAGKHKVGTQCCDLADNNIVNGQCSFCPAGKQKVGNQCCNLTEDFIVAGRCSVCSADQKLIGNKCCAKTDNFVVGGQCSVCSADQKLIGGKCCAKTDNFVVGGQCSFCEAGKHKVGTQCCDLADNNIVNGQCSFCPAGKQKVGNQCCNLTEDFIVAGRCSVCSADQKLIGNKCCAKTDNFVVGGQCSECAEGKHKVGSQCCNTADKYVVNNLCSFCPVGKKKIGDQCCDSTDNFVVGGQCSFCPAGKQKVGGQCCALTEDFIVAGRCSVCPADKKLIGNKCCAKTDNFVVGGQCSECAEGKHKVGGQCCALTEDFIVNGQCSVCAADKKLISGKCCSQTDTSVVNGVCVAEKCQAYKLNIKAFAKQGLIGNGTYDDIVDVNDDTPSCLSNQLKKAYKECSSYYNLKSGDDKKNIKWIDDCVLVAFTDYYEDWATSGMKQFASGSEYLTLEQIQKGWDKKKEFTEYSSYYFDKDCKKLPDQNIAADKACLAARVSLYNSPISLQFDSNIKDLNDESVIVKFKLSPGPEEYVVWKASEKAPLLVYDPSHSGVVSSYVQLFGEWTFGGRALASLENLLTDQTTSRVAWEDGYSALSTLDINMDGKIAGEELSSLSLWFDANRNAVSEPGEVRSLVSEGIRALFYRDKVKNELNQDLRVEVGFEREVNGKLVVGRSVDWYGVVGNTEAQLLQRNNTLRALCQSGPQVDPEDQDSDVAAVVAPDPGFSGVWIWQSNDKDPSKVVGGVLAFKGNDGGKFQGTSIIEVSADEKSSAYANVISTFGLTGGLSRSVDGDGKDLIFKINSSNGVRLESKVKISEDKKSLIGQTWAVRGTNEGKELLTQYSWTASRYKE